MDFKDSKKYFPAFILITLGIAARFLPHPANFTPIGAVAVFSGIYLPKKFAVILPLSAMFFSDLFIGFYSWKIMLSVYICFAVAGLIGLQVRKNKKSSMILGGTILGSVIFYLVTNFAVWAFGGWYGHNLAGLASCYYMAIPFFKNSLLGDLFYIGILAGSYEAVIAISRAKKKAEAVAA
ncbi:MAG: DUF6580 family putative transport protein [bacterium]